VRSIAGLEPLVAAAATGDADAFARVIGATGWTLGLGSAWVGLILKLWL
jgi:hypothetical protein